MSEPLPAVAALAEQLRELKLLAGDPSLTQLEKLTVDLGERMPRATISEKLTGRSKPDLDQLNTFVQACCVYADRVGMPLPQDLRDKVKWRERWLEMSRSRSNQRRRHGHTPQTGDTPAGTSPSSTSAVAVDPTEGGNAAAGNSVTREDGHLESIGQSLSEALAARIAATRESDRALFRSVATSPTRGAVFHALDRAVQLGLIPQDGCRVRLSHTSAFIRFAPDPEERSRWSPMGFSLERSDTEQLSFVEWDDEASVLDFLLKITETVQAIGLYPGDSRFAPDQAFSDLGLILELAYRQSIATDSDAQTPAIPIIQICPPQWAITSSGLISIRDAQGYIIPNARLNKQDWAEHLQSKPWVNQDNFDEALEDAKQLNEAWLRKSQRYITNDEPPF